MHARLLSLILALGLMLGLAGAAAGSAPAQEGSVTPVPTLAPFDPASIPASLQDEAVIYARYDVAITVHQDGRFHVREVQQVYFNDAFRTAFAEIPRDYVSEIANVSVSTPDETYTMTSPGTVTAGTFSVSADSDAILVEWAYRETRPGDVRTFIVDYDVMGGLWVYPDGDILEWRAIPADRSGVPVLASTVTVTLPDAVAGPDLYVNAFGVPYSSNVAGAQVSFTTGDLIPDGTAFQIMVGFPHGLVDATIQPWQRREDSAELIYSVPSLLTEMRITSDGLVVVTEHQEIQVEAGTLYEGRRVIPLVYVDGLTAVAVSEGSTPMRLTDATAPCDYCYWLLERPGAADWLRLDRSDGDLSIYEKAGGEMTIGWRVPPLVTGERTTFDIQYTAVGALALRENSQTLNWTVTSNFDGPVDAATLLLDLPPDVTLQDISVENGEARDGEDGRVVITPPEGTLGGSEPWQVQIHLPQNATSAQRPAWQQELDEAIAASRAIQEANLQAEQRRARQQLLFALVAGLFFVGGLLAVLFVWYRFGRDDPALPVPTYLSEPPSSLPPGIVAYLLDEKPTPKGVLASLFQLAAYGLLQVRLTDPLLISRNWDEALGEGEQIETPSGDRVSLPAHMATLFNELRSSLGTEATPLPQIAPALRTLMPRVYALMGEEASRFFDELPGDTRYRWLVRGQWLVLGGVGLTLAAAVIYVSSLGWIAITPAVALAMVGLALMVVSRWMPRRSDVGAMEAARWRAFEQYLDNLKTYGDETAAQEILDRYFAYAVALDVEDVVLSQAAEMGSKMPSWTRPIVVYRPLAHSTMAQTPGTGPLRTRQASATRGGETAASPATTPVSGLEGATRNLTKSLERANDTITGVLSAAIGEKRDTPFEVVFRGAKGAGKLTWDATATTLQIMNDILDEASAGGGSSHYSGGSRSWRPSSRSSFGSRRSASRSSSGRRSGGGGRRGFGR